MLITKNKLESYIHEICKDLRLKHSAKDVLFCFLCLPLSIPISVLCGLIHCLGECAPTSSSGYQAIESENQEPVWLGLPYIANNTFKHLIFDKLADSFDSNDLISVLNEEIGKLKIAYSVFVRDVSLNSSTENSSVVHTIYHSEFDDFYKALKLDGQFNEYKVTEMELNNIYEIIMKIMEKLLNKITCEANQNKNSLNL